MTGFWPMGCEETPWGRRGGLSAREPPRDCGAARPWSLGSQSILLPDHPPARSSTSPGKAHPCLSVHSTWPDTVRTALVQLEMPPGQNVILEYVSSVPSGQDSLFFSFWRGVKILSIVSNGSRTWLEKNLNPLHFSYGFLGNKVSVYKCSGVLERAYHL